MKIIVYDATLREGAQSADATFTLADKIRMAQLLDDFGVDYIEGGLPGNPADEQFYAAMQKTPLKHAKLAVFGPTARPNTPPQEDKMIAALLQAQTQVVCIFGKAWDFHVTQVLRTTPEENLRMIDATVRYLVQCGKEVVFDAEHFFDGYKANPAYALAAIKTAQNAGAAYICLCDTNGGCMPQEVQAITADVMAQNITPLGIHCHNDAGMAQANTVLAIQSGCVMAQVTVNGWGERCGNADLCTLLPNLQLKLGYACVPAEKLRAVSHLSRAFYEIANVRFSPFAPYVGQNAFAHKAGMHIDAIIKNPLSFEHVSPESVGNMRTLLLSDIAGRSAVWERVKTIAPHITRESATMEEIVRILKQKEAQGYSYAGADASFALLVQKIVNPYQPFFHLKDYKVIESQPSPQNESASALIRIHVDGEEEVAAAIGNGPVNAIDRAMRRALEKFYPALSGVRLTDFTVRVLDSKQATASHVRVLIESADANTVWHTIGVSGDVIDASWIALVDAIEYKLLMLS